MEDPRVVVTNLVGVVVIERERSEVAHARRYRYHRGLWIDESVRRSFVYAVVCNPIHPLLCFHCALASDCNLPAVTC